MSVQDLIPVGIPFWGVAWSTKCDNKMSPIDGYLSRGILPKTYLGRVFLIWYNE